MARSFVFLLGGPRPRDYYRPTIDVFSTQSRLRVRFERTFPHQLFQEKLDLDYVLVQLRENWTILNQFCPARVSLTPYTRRNASSQGLEELEDPSRGDETRRELGCQVVVFTEWEWRRRARPSLDMAMGMPDLWVRVPVRLGADVPPCEGVLKASQMTFSFHTRNRDRERERREKRERERMTKEKKSCGFRGCLLSCPKSLDLGRQSVGEIPNRYTSNSIQTMRQSRTIKEKAARFGRPVNQRTCGLR